MRRAYKVCKQGKGGGDVHVTRVMGRDRVITPYIRKTNFSFLFSFCIGKALANLQKIATALRKAL